MHTDAHTDLISDLEALHIGDDLHVPFDHLQVDFDFEHETRKLLQSQTSHFQPFPPTASGNSSTNSLKVSSATSIGGATNATTTQLEEQHPQVGGAAPPTGQTPPTLGLQLQMHQPLPLLVSRYNPPLVLPPQIVD